LYEDIKKYEKALKNLREVRALYNILDAINIVKNEGLETIKRVAKKVRNYR
jgi:hypothetical protein